MQNFSELVANFFNYKIYLVVKRSISDQDGDGGLGFQLCRFMKFVIGFLTMLFFSLSFQVALNSASNPSVVVTNISFVEECLIFPDVPPAGKNTFFLIFF